MQERSRKILMCLSDGRDNLTSYATVSAFARQIGATLTVMETGEHRFHTEEQMQFLDGWLCDRSRR